ncbi:MAG: hypothetical protein LAP13_23010, partial [Acidobacteriia bacterium]|nr:hypothetical protein [Terriglobia bacterium]
MKPSFWKSTGFLLFFGLMVCSFALGAPIQPTVQRCSGTMSFTSNEGVARITIGKPNPMFPPDGGCSLQGAEFNVSENPVFDFWIRIQGSHTVAFNLAFGQGGLNYPGYKTRQDHVINVVGTQVGMTSLGDLGTVNDGKWHHVVFDLGYAVNAELNLDPAKIGEASLGIFDRQSSLDLFAGAPSQSFPTTIELRDMVLRPRESGERYSNDLSFTVSSAAIGTSNDGSKKYLVGGSVVAREPLDGLKVVVGSETRQNASETLGTVQGRKNFAFILTVSPNTSDLQARLVAADGKDLASRKLTLSPELTYLQGATINIIPNSHNDIGWLDSAEATANWRRDMVIGPAILLLEKYPEYRYGMETNLYLMEYLNRAPTQADIVHKLIAEGHLTFGATYNQPYESLWRGESLVRELYYGRKWLREHLGSDVDSVTAWGTDVPAVALQFPQVLAKSGVKYLMLGRFRPGIFDWYSPDGSKVTVGSLGIYGRLAAYLTPYEPANVALQVPGLLRHWDDFYKQHNIPPQFPITDMTDYLPPTKELIPLQQEWDSAVRQKFGVQLKMKFATGEEFMNAVSRDSATKFPELHGEWPNNWAYIHGPTHHATVSAGREAGWNLVAGEEFWTLRNLLSHGTERYPSESFDQAWMAQIYPDHG